MNKLFLPYLLLLLPVFALAQGESHILYDVDKKTMGIASSFKLNDSVGVMQVRLTDTTFELVALDNKMSVLWRDTSLGYGVACGKFKDHILAISDSGYSSKKGNISPYYAFLIDPATGRIILQRAIFQQKAKHEEQATAFFAADGSDFNLIVRQANIRVGELSSYRDKTEDFTIINLDKNLDPTFLKPRVPDETFISMAFNTSGDLFLLTTTDNLSVKARRYEHGSVEPSEPIAQACDSLDNYDILYASNAIVASQEDRNVFYLSIGHTNHDDDRVISTVKFDFSSRKSYTTNELFTGKHVREIEKSFTPFSHDFWVANLGSAKRQMRVRYIMEHNGKLITVSAEFYFAYPNDFSSTNHTVGVFGEIEYDQFTLVINCYDTDLKQRFQQVMPVIYKCDRELATGFEFSENDVKILSNGGFGPAYGQLDLSTGKWLKLELLSNHEISDANAIWFNDNFVVPFLRERGQSHPKYNIDLGLNNY